MNDDDDYPYRPCVGCGYCCTKAPCVLAARIFETRDWQGCPALRFHDGRHWCGLVEDAEDPPALDGRAGHRRGFLFALQLPPPRMVQTTPGCRSILLRLLSQWFPVKPAARDFWSNHETISRALPISPGMMSKTNPVPRGLCSASLWTTPRVAGATREHCNFCGTEVWLAPSSHTAFSAETTVYLACPACMVKFFQRDGKIAHRCAGGGICRTYGAIASKAAAWMRGVISTHNQAAHFKENYMDLPRRNVLHPGCGRRARARSAAHCLRALDDQSRSARRQGRAGTWSVSTVFLGMDHNWRREGPPILFETMVFGGRYAGLQLRYATRPRPWPGMPGSHHGSLRRE